MYGRLQDIRSDAPLGNKRVSDGDSVQDGVSWKQRLFGGKISPPTQDLEESDKREDSEYAWKIAAVEVRVPLFMCRRIS